MKDYHNHHLHHEPRRGRPFQRGDFKYIILRHLSEKPSYGYELIRALQERSHNFYVPSPGSVYPTLQMLEEMGYVTSGDLEGKRVYTITEEGRAFLEEGKESADRIDSRIDNWWNPENINDLKKTMSELGKLAGLLREKARTADTEKLKRMRKALSRAFKEISKE
jgi:DNA-binding PadR family transcriptional regulator